MNKKEDQDIKLTLAEKEWFHSPEVRAEFRTDLKRRLIDYQKNHQNHPSSAATQKAKRIWDPFNWPGLEGLWPSGLAGGIISLIFALVLVSGVVYAVSKYAGYLPGFGMVPQDAPVRVLSSVESQTKEGIQLKIVSAFVSQEQTSIIYSIKGIPPDVFAGNDPLDPQMQRCSGGVRAGLSGGIRLGLPDGQTLSPLGAGSLGYGKDNDYQKVVFFKTIPKNVNTIRFQMDCIEGALPKAAPENWSIPLTLEERANDLQTFPVLKKETHPESETKNSILVSELIPFADKFIVLGRYIPGHTDINFASLNLRVTNVSFLDVNGNRLPYNIPGDIQFFNPEEAGRFAYIVDANRASFPVTLQIEGISYYCDGNLPYTIELKDFPPDNKIHNVDETLNMGHCKVKIVSISNSGTMLTLKFAADGYKVNDVSVRDIHDPTSIQTTTTKSYGISANVQLSATNLMNNQKIDLEIGAVGLGPLGPLSTKIELQEYQ